MLPSATSSPSPRNQRWLSSSPFKKLSHLKGSCYSLPARRKLEWTGKPSGSLVKSTDTSGQPPPVNLVTFRAQDMSGESFSTLQMQNIMSSLQHQLGSPQRSGSIDLTSGDSVSANVAQSLTQDVGEEGESHTSVYSATASQLNAQDDCTVHHQDVQPLREAHDPEGHRSAVLIDDSASTQVCMKVTT